MKTNMRERIKVDAQLHNMFKFMYQQVELLELTPSELRELSMLVSIEYEMRHPCPLLCAYKENKSCRK